jgi:hypothetical protein
MSPGEIYWVDLPGANGHEQRGRRPGIVLQDEQSVGELPVVIVIPLTTSRAALRFSGPAGERVAVTISRTGVSGASCRPETDSGPTWKSQHRRACGNLFRAGPSDRTRVTPPVRPTGRRPTHESVTAYKVTRNDAPTLPTRRSSALDKPCLRCLGSCPLS